MNSDSLQETMMLIAKEIITALNLITKKLDEIKAALPKSSGVNMDAIKDMLESKSKEPGGSGGQNESFF